jgi:hypothetical protein
MELEEEIVNIKDVRIMENDGKRIADIRFSCNSSNQEWKFIYAKYNFSRDYTLDDWIFLGLVSQRIQEILSKLTYKLGSDK